MELEVTYAGVYETELNGYFIAGEKYSIVVSKESNPVRNYSLDVRKVEDIGRVLFGFKYTYEEFLLDFEF